MDISLAFLLRRGRRLAATIPLTAVAALALSHATAFASSGSQFGSIGQYGEVTRFGGFDSTWFDDGRYDGKGAVTPETEPAPGKFLDPSGFAVDTNDEGKGTTAIYVLDSVSGWTSEVGAQGTEWRLQKLSTTGAVLGTTEFYLPKDETPGASEAKYDVFAGAVGLAIDDSTGRIYTVIYDSVGEEEETTRQADEIIDWSTTPDGGRLVAPNGSSTTDSSSTKITPVGSYPHPGVLSTSTDLEGTPLYEPQGLALDVTGGKNYLAIQADANTRVGSQGTRQGPVLVQQVSTETGDETATWSANSLTTPSLVTNASSEDAKATAAGISTDPNGDLNVLLATTEGATFDYLDDIELSASLSSPTVLAAKAIEPTTVYNGGGEVRYPSAALLDNPTPTLVNQPSGGLGNGGDARDQVVGLSNSLYASDFFDSFNGGYWNGSINEGIRLVKPEGDGLLSNPLAPVTSIFDTLGNATAGGNCYLGEGNVGAANNVTLAAGASGTIWVLTEGNEDSRGASGGAEAKFLTGREVIELAPGASKTCAQPAGTFSLATGGTPAPAGSALTVAVGATVEFDGSAIEYPANGGGKQAGIYAYEWDPTGASTGGPGNDGYTIVNDTLGSNNTSTHAEPTTASYTYTASGEYTVGLKLLGDFGEYDETRTVIVQTSQPPTASLTAPAEAQTGQSVSFSAAGSAPASGQTIADYHWSFGDGQSDDTQTPSDTHVYSSTGTHTVTLTVRDKDDRESTPVTQKITITSPPATKTETPTTTSTTPTTTTTTPASSPPPVAQIDRSATNVSPKALEKSGEVQVTVTCPATKVSCAGTVEVKTATAVAARVAKKGAAKKSVLVLGQTSFSLKGGQRETLTIKLSAKGAALLKKSKRLKADVLVAAHDSYGDPGSQTLGLTLTEPAKKAAKKK
jgi:PKD repeat protein